MIKSVRQNVQLRRAARWTREAMRAMVSIPLTMFWPPYSRLLLRDDRHDWVIKWEMIELAALAEQLGIKLVSEPSFAYMRRQAVFYGGRGFLRADWWKQQHRVGFPYFHGLPHTGFPIFDHYYARICQHHEHLHAIQVSHQHMYDVLMQTGIAAEKLFLIPIGINLNFFRPATPADRRQVRQRYGIPEQAVVIGSFQKDGDGWGEGMSPKWIKGPDVFLDVIARLQPHIPELFVLLSGPARGYVRAGLEQLKVPYHHVHVPHYPDIGELYHALDLYVIASRQEGGPKAVLESMASGIPLVSTQVGQATDLIQHGSNGWLAAVEDSDALAHRALHALQSTSDRDAVIQQGILTAQANTYTALSPRWRRLLHTLVEVP